MNYSETYFKLDSEEATHCDHCHLIYIKGHVKTVDTKDQSNAIVYHVWYLVCRHCRYKDQIMQCIECYVCQDCRYTGVCGTYTTPYTEYYEVWKLYSTLYKVASSPLQGGRHLMCLPPCGFSCSPVWGGSFVNFLGIVKLQGWLQARHTANPQFLKLRERSATQ